MKYDELRRLAEAATPGPWDYEPRLMPFLIQVAPPAQIINAPTIEDAAYIAATSPDVILALLDERERLREALKRAASHVPQGAPDALYDLETYIRPFLKDDPVELTP